MTLPVAILAGGLATRLYPLTQDTPKSLVPVNGEPSVLHQLRMLARHGLREIIFLIGHLGSMIQDAVGDGSRFGLQISYVHEGEQRRGTAGAIRHAAPHLPPEFFVQYGDTYLDCDYAAVEKAFYDQAKPALMTACFNQSPWGEISNVRYAPPASFYYNKHQPAADMQYIDYGLAILRREVVAQAPDPDPFDLADLYTRLCDAGQMASWLAPHFYHEIGSFRGIQDLEAYLATNLL